MQQVENLLTAQQVQLSTLSQLLTAELEAYKQRKPDMVYDIAIQKNEMLIKIQQTDQEIAALDNLAELKLNNDFNTLVKQLETQLTEIKQQNAINERVIRTSLNNVMRLKQSILALKNSDAMTYDKLGQAQTQTLGKGIKA